jgi:hypothetical protein
MPEVSTKLLGCEKILPPFNKLVKEALETLEPSVEVNLKNIDLVYIYLPYSFVL